MTYWVLGSHEMVEEFSTSRKFPMEDTFAAIKIRDCHGAGTSHRSALISRQSFSATLST